MPSTHSFRRQIALLGFAILNVCVFAAAATPVSADLTEPAFSNKTLSGQSVRSNGQIAAATAVTPKMTSLGKVPLETRESIDDARLNHGGDANANDVALFRQVIAFASDGNDPAWTSGGLLALLFGGLLFSQRLKRNNKTQTKSRSQPYLPA
ncbi:MAG TPA: hypothetical protein PLB97_09630 [Accumulibacter sp.]|nr:hypothetical protein [Accumulibacter sp.]